MIYFLIGSYLLFLVFIETDKKYRAESMLGCYLALLFMVFLAALRDGVGTDWYAYLSFYKNPVLGEKTEVAYSFINSLFSTSGVHYNVFLFAISSFTVSLTALSLRYLKVFSAAAILVYFSDLYLYLGFSGVRQGIALSIAMYSVKYAIERNLFVFTALIMAAACFHTSALIFLAAYFVPRTRLSIANLIFAVSLVFIFVHLMPELAALAVKYTGKQALYYLESTQQSSLNLLDAFIVGSVRRLAPLAVLFWFRKSIDSFPNYLYILNLYCIGVLIYLSAYLFSPDFGVRLSVYFTIFESVLLAIAATKAPGIAKRLFVASFIACIAIFKLSSYSVDPFFEYRSIF